MSWRSYEDIQPNFDLSIDISYLMICLIIGAITNNISMMHRLIYAELRQTEMPFYDRLFRIVRRELTSRSFMAIGDPAADPRRDYFNNNILLDSIISPAQTR